MPNPGLLHPEPLPLRRATADPDLRSRHPEVLWLSYVMLWLSYVMAQTVMAQSLWGLWVLGHIRFVWALWASLASTGFDSKCNVTPPTILLGLLLCPWTWGKDVERALSLSSAYHHRFWAPRIRWCSLQTSGMWAHWQGRRQSAMSHPAGCPGWGAQVRGPRVWQSHRGPWPWGWHARGGHAASGQGGRGLAKVNGIVHLCEKEIIQEEKCWNELPLHPDGGGTWHN